MSHRNDPRALPALASRMQAAPSGMQENAQLAFDAQAGAVLHHRRRSLGLTATDVARRVGISQRRMARLELGLEPLTLRLALGIGDVLGMPPDWFLQLRTAAAAESTANACADATQGDWSPARSEDPAEAHELAH